MTSLRWSLQGRRRTSRLFTELVVSPRSTIAAIKPIGQLLTTLPFGPSAPGRTAGPTFELFYIGGYLLPHRQAAWTLIAERLRQAAGLARRLEGEGLVLKGVIAGLEKYATQLEASS